MHFQNFGVYNYLDISTVHIPQDLLDMDCDYKICSYPEGAFFYVPEVDVDTVPDALVPIFNYARRNKCVIVRFDADGLSFPGDFPEYDWD